jgi:DNA/RNA endonuclease YhcR with UshA esterase domain
MRKFASFKVRLAKSTIALSLVLSLQVGFGNGISSVMAEGPTDPAPYIQAKIVNQNAGKKILFDNTHGQTAGAADWVIDGAFSDFGNALANDGYDVKELRKTSPITYNDLQEYDVFVIAEANIPFKQSEQLAMEQYVNNGNSIFFIGDHYNADRNKNRWDGSESMNGYRRGAWADPAQGMSTDERNSTAMQDVVSSDWLGSKFGVRFRYNALGDITANDIVAPAQAFGITTGVSTVAMHAGSTLAIMDPTKAKGIVYLPATNAAWGNAVDQGVYNGGGIAEGPYVAVSKVGAGKAAFIGDSSPVEDVTPKYLREETGTKKTTYDGFKEQNDGVLLVNLINWLSEDESYTSLDQVSNLQLDQATALLPIETPQTSTEPQAEPWSAPAAGYKWWDSSTYKAGSYGGPTASVNASYSFVHQAQLPNAQNFQIRVIADNLPANSTVSGFSTGIYLTGGTQVAKVQNGDGTWPSSYGYSTTFSMNSNSNGRAYKDLTVQIKSGATGAANLRLRQNGSNLITSAVQIANVPAETLPEEGNPIPNEITVAEARSLAEGTIVTLEGIVTTEPGAFGGQAFYLQDETAGIYVYQNLSGFHQGDTVKITAPLAIYNTELELTDPIAMEKTGTSSLPALLQVTTVNDTNQGQLIQLQDVTIHNIVSASPAGSFEFDAVSGSVSTHVRVDARTGLSLSDFSYLEGQVVHVQGVAAIFKGVFQLKPRGISDLTIPAQSNPPVTTASLSSSPNENNWYNNDVALTLVATGTTNEIITTKYSMNGGEEVLYTGPLVLQTEGLHTIQYYSVSTSGKSETIQSLQLKLDKTAPSVVVTQSGQPIADMKLQDELKFELVSTDSLSGVSTQKLLLDAREINSGELVKASDLGLGIHTLQYSVLDLAGNLSKQSLQFTVVNPLATGAPGKPVLSDNNGHITGLKGGNYTVTMNLWWGNNGSIFKLYENGVLISTQNLSDASPSAQAVKTDITGKSNGIYTYTAELINVYGITTSNQLNVTVSDASPGKSVLSQDNWDGDGNYKLMMNLWWGSNGSEYRLYENGQLIDTKSLSEVTPNTQNAMTDLSGRAVGEYEYFCELINAVGSTSSDVIKVKVVK